MQTFICVPTKLYLVSLKEMTMDSITSQYVGLGVGVVGLILAMAGFAYGIYENRQRRKLSDFLKTITQSFPGEVAKMEQSCNWGWNNVRNALKEAAKIPDSEEKRELIRILGDAMGDTRTGINSCVQLFHGLLTFQEAQFGTRNITHPQRNSLGLVQEEFSNRAAPIQTAANPIA
jgi:hypothetical protein